MSKKLMVYILVLTFLLFFKSYGETTELKVVGVNNDYPYMFLDKNGEASGIAVDFLKDFAKEKDLTIGFSLYSPEEAVEEFEKSGDLLYFSDFTIKNINYKESIPFDIKNFHIYYNNETNNNLQKVQSFYEDVDLLELTNIGVRIGQKNSSYVNKLASEDHLFIYGDYSTLLKDLNEGTIEVGVLPHLQSDHLIITEGHENIGWFDKPVFYKELTFKSRSTTLLDKLNIHIINDKKIGKIPEFHKKWLETKPKNNTGSKTILLFNIVSAVMVIMLLAMFLWNSTLQKKVKDRTKELEVMMIENKSLYESIIEKEKFKNDYFMNLSHELRTPLNIILSAVQLNEDYLNKEEFDKIIQNADTYTEIIRTNSYRLLRVVNNIIDINKIETGSYKLNIDYVDIVYIAENIIKSIVPFTSAKGIKLKFSSEFDELFIECDPFEIERVILNLLSNAIKFTDANGNIEVRIVKNNMYKEVVISVKDTGVGIAKESQKVVFEKYRQENSELTRNNEGNGLGLSLVDSIVKMHGGSINLFSELGVGSEFVVHLPLQSKYEGIIDKRKDFVYQLHSQNKRVDLEFADLESIEKI